jgi:hypothetical protein
MHMSVTANGSTTVLGFFMVISSTVLMSLTPLEGIDDLDVLDIRDGVPRIAEMFHVVSEALIMLLLDGL